MNYPHIALKAFSYVSHEVLRVSGLGLYESRLRTSRVAVKFRLRGPRVSYRSLNTESSVLGV